MTDIEKKALALLKEVLKECGYTGAIVIDRNCEPQAEALCRAIEQHEAFRQEVSEELQWFWKYTDGGVPGSFERFIITKPVDPLAECLMELDLSENDEQARHDAEWLVKTLAKRGGKIVWEEG